MKAYYFSNMDKKLRYNDNRQIRKGRTHKVKGDLKLCGHGLHASIKAIDALRYAPSSYLWVVELSGDIVHGDDKIVASERTYLHGFNTDKLLRKFAHKQALINIEKIKPYTNADDYELIVTYLESGDDNKRSTTESAAESAAKSAAWSAAESAARSAAWSVKSATESAARSAAWSAANEMLEEMLDEFIKQGETP